MPASTEQLPVYSYAGKLGLLAFNNENTLELLSLSNTNLMAICNYEQI